jgi:hypothetical protein
MILLLFHFFAVLFVALAVWDMYGIIAALVAIVVASVPFLALIAFVQHRLATLIVRDA